jgi:hypothetical protein
MFDLLISLDLIDLLGPVGTFMLFFSCYTAIVRDILGNYELCLISLRTVIILSEIS